MNTLVMCGYISVCILAAITTAIHESIGHRRAPKPTDHAARETRARRRLIAWTALQAKK